MEQRIAFLERIAAAPTASAALALPSAAGADDDSSDLRGMRAGGGGAAASASDAADAEPVLATLQAIHAKLRRITDERRTIAEFLHKYASLKDVLQTHSTDLDVSTLDANTKKEIVLAADDEILQAADLLKTLDSLQAEVNSTALNGLNGYTVALRPVEVTQIELSKMSAKAKDRFVSVLSEYNNYVRGLMRLRQCSLIGYVPLPGQIAMLSQVFLHYDDLISTLENEFR
ncbi:hypothetical protein HK405_004204 [Cladochytrium tenue]|nr:hypothetical protein HK405_004204 [Cladochytrium tenue]